MHFLGGPNGYIVLKALHVLAAVTWVGGAIGQNVMATRIIKTNDGPTMASFAKEAEWIGTRVFLPSSVLLLVLGIIMVAGFDLWDFSDLWVELGILGIVITVITGATVIGPTSKKIGQTIAENGPDDPALGDQIARLLRIARIDLVVLILVVVDMVTKPVL